MVLAMTCLGYELLEERWSPFRLPGRYRRARLPGEARSGQTPLLSRGADLLLERRQADRADDNFGADDIARGAVEPQCLGDAHVLLERGLGFVAGHVLFDARHVEADLLGDRERMGPVGLASAAEQLLMELEILFAGRVLHAHRHRNLRRLHRARPQHRKFLEHDAKLRILLHQVEHVAQRPLAIAAVVIEELDQGYVTLAISDRDLARRVEQYLTVLFDALPMLGCIGVALAFFEFVDDFLKHLGMGDEIVLDDALDIAALGIRERLGARRERGDRQHGCRDRDQKWAEQALHLKFPFSCGWLAPAACRLRCHRPGPNREIRSETGFWPAPRGRARS